MREIILLALLCYIALISLVSICVCIYDKWAAKHKTESRIRERTLLLLSALGGSLAMYLTMQMIRHKTRHAKFMIGIPVIILLQGALIGFLIYKGVI